MQLKYRGATYESNPGVPNISSSETMQVTEWEAPEKYRWVSFQAKHLIAILMPFDHHMKYRGVSY